MHWKLHKYCLLTSPLSLCDVLLYSLIDTDNLYIAETDLFVCAITV